MKMIKVELELDNYTYEKVSILAKKNKCTIEQMIIRIIRFYIK